MNTNTIPALLASLKKPLPKKYGMWELTGQDRHYYWLSRGVAQAEYAYAISQLRGHRFDEAILDALYAMGGAVREEGFVTKSAVLEAERRLAPVAEEAKALTVLFVGHAHIDMNWEWGWDETVSVTLDTFETVLKLMREYPAFKFSQSQAAIYRIVEQYDPDMLAEIHSRVQEGRWEVSASTWVEADKNMPNTESHARQMIYAKGYLSRTLGIDPDTLNLDFEPDTFGHPLHTPEILTAGGVKYYYHCRGFNGPSLYRWKAPSGRSVIAYREPMWYNDNVEPYFAAFVPALCREYGMRTFLKVFGVGDHGGGPTRRDLERILDMQTWPIFPELRFGKYADFFAAAESSSAELPEVTGELNFVAPGCYTTQTRIKVANRTSENALNEAELFSATATLAFGSRYPRDVFETSWRDVLFAQFHDILPGSGVVETREHAMGKFQETMAAVNTRKKRTLADIAGRIDTSKLPVQRGDWRESTSEGAGAGHGASAFRVTAPESAASHDRIIHLFNSSLLDREETTEVLLWDWTGDHHRIVVKDADGNAVPHQVLDYGTHRYWSHHYSRLLIQAKVPACGYQTYVISESEHFESAGTVSNLPRTSEHEYRFTLENERLKVAFDPVNGAIRSLIDKRTGMEHIDPNRFGGGFRFIEEDIHGGSAWDVGRYMAVRPLDARARLRMLAHKQEREFDKMFGTIRLTGMPEGHGALRQSLSYEVDFGSSKLKALISLDRGSSALRYEVECDWHERGSAADRRVPQLNFHLPLNYRCASYKYDVPAGVIERRSMNMDAPGNSFVQAVREDGAGGSAMLVTRSGYGFRGFDDAISATLIRSSFDPDPDPELGNVRLGFAIVIDDADSNRDALARAYHFNHPFSLVSGAVRQGDLPASHSFFRLLQGNVAVSAVKLAENGDRLILRVYETEGGSAANVTIQLPRTPKRAGFADIQERLLGTDTEVVVQGDCIRFTVEANRLVTVALEF